MFILVAITMALFVRIEPMLILGVRINIFYSIGIIIILAITQDKILSFIGITKWVEKEVVEKQDWIQE